jgi:hypothetical protein
VQLDWEFGQLKRGVPPGKAEGLRAESRAGMEVDLRWFESEACADPQRGVVDGQLPDAADWLNDRCDQLEQVVEGLCLAEARQVAEQVDAPQLPWHRRSSGENDRWPSVLAHAAARSSFELWFVDEAGA